MKQVDNSMAKTIASEFAANSQLKSETLAKINERFDGDYNIKFSDFSPETKELLIGKAILAQTAEKKSNGKLGFKREVAANCVRSFHSQMPLSIVPVASGQLEDTIMGIHIRSFFAVDGHKESFRPKRKNIFKIIIIFSLFRFSTIYSSVGFSGAAGLSYSLNNPVLFLNVLELDRYDREGNVTKTNQDFSGYSASMALTYDLPLVKFPQLRFWLGTGLANLGAMTLEGRHANGRYYSFDHNMIAVTMDIGFLFAITDAFRSGFGLEYDRIFFLITNSDRSAGELHGLDKWIYAGAYKWVNAWVFRKEERACWTLEFNVLNYNQDYIHFSRVATRESVAVQALVRYEYFWN